MSIKNQQMGKNHMLIDTDVLLIDKMKKMLAEEHSNEEYLLVVVQHKCLSKNHAMPSEGEGRIMLKDSVIRSFCFQEFARIRAGLGF